MVTLSGIGIAPPGVSLSPFSTVAFPATGVGLTSATQKVTLTNNGGVPLLVQSIAVTGDFVVVPGSNTCSGNVAVNAACTLQVAFAPTVGGARSGALTVTDNAPNSPQTLSLTGSGVDFTLNPNGGTSLTIANGQNAVYPLLLSSSANVSGTAAFTCSGTPANSTCNITPSSVTLGNTTTVSVTVLTGVPSTAGLPHKRIIRPEVFWVVVLIPLGFATVRRRRRFLFVSSAVLSCLLTATGCGAGRSIPLENGSNPNQPVPVTPAGTYSIVASARARDSLDP